jgi:hypothetical protein
LIVGIIAALLLAGILIGYLVYRKDHRTVADPAPEYLERYLDHVFSACIRSGAGEPFIRKIATKYEADHNSVSWGELFTVESYLLSNEPLPTLRRRAWNIRDKFREVVGQRQYETYLLSAPPNENKLADGDDELLRSDLGRLLDALHWSYALIPIREKIRAQIIRYVVAQIVAWVLFLLALIILCAWYDQSFLATLLFVFMAGAQGGFLSLLRRIQLTPTTGDPLLSIFELENGRVSLYLAPTSGGIFALVLFFVFQAGLLQGALFPELGEAAMRLSIGKFNWQQANPSFSQYAMLMVWSFIAGFAERLVPDTLSRLVQRSEEATSDTRTTPPAGQGRDTTAQSVAGSPPTDPRAVLPGRGGSPAASPPRRPTGGSPPFRLSPP